MVQKGLVRVTFDADTIKSPNICSLKCDKSKDEDISSKEASVEKTEGCYFGEWVLLGERVGSLTAVAVGDVSCALLTKEKFDSIIGPLTKLSEDQK